MTSEQKAAIIAKGTLSRSKGTGPSGLELKVREVLDELGIPWLADQKVSGFFPDLLLPASKTLVEVNGCYWHACTSCFPDHRDAERMHKRDRMKVGAYRKAGYDLAVIAEHDFLDDPEGAVRSALQGVI